MTQKSSATLVAKGANGTTTRKLHITGIAEHWHLEEPQGPTDFTKVKFEQALKKVSRRINKREPKSR